MAGMRPQDSPVVLVLGPALDAVSGVSTHLRQLFGSELAQTFRLIHFQVGSEGRRETVLGRLVRFCISPVELWIRICISKAVIVHLNTSIDTKSLLRDLVYLYISKLIGVRIIYQIHGGELPCEFSKSSTVLSRIFQWSLQLPDKVVVLGQAQERAYRQFCRSRQLVLIPNAIQLDDFRGVREKNFGTKNLRLGYIGRLAFDKGIQDILEAIHVLKQDELFNSKMEFRIAGTGPYEKWLRERVSQLGLDECVQFLGPVFGDNKIKFWHEIEVFVFPTFHKEGLPYSVLESLASGTPMITTYEGGISDAVKGGTHTLFVEARNPKRVAEAIRSLATDPHLLTGMSRRCIERAEEYYGIGRLASQFSRVYLDVL